MSGTCAYTRAHYSVLPTPGYQSAFDNERNLKSPSVQRVADNPTYLADSENVALQTLIRGASTAYLPDDGCERNPDRIYSVAQSAQDHISAPSVIDENVQFVSF